MCLDLACGGGLHHAAIASTGRIVIGLDLSADQLQVARKRTANLVRGDVCRLPFQDSLFTAIVCTYLHTDIDDMKPVFQEVYRTLRAGGVFVYVGVHPCFWGHFIESPGLPDRIVHPGYLHSGWIESPYQRNPTGLRAKVGARHATISELVNSAIAASLDVLRLEELGTASGHADKIAIVASRRR
jgi:SAM-dependent methyltransferase